MYEEMYSCYSKCICGAISLFPDDPCDTPVSFMNTPNVRMRFVRGLDLRKLHRLQNTCCCDHCVNHYGLELCACGSGQPYESCDENLEECGAPMEALGERMSYAVRF